MVLIVVDFQNDFCSENGALYVEGANRALWNIKSLLDEGNVSKVIFTADWHPVDHCSFKENGGVWPVHCIQYSEGAAINDLLLTTCRTRNIPYNVVTKGFLSELEEYGAFSHSRVELDDEVVICGIAGDYCVLETLKNILLHLNPKVFVDGIASIDGGAKLNKFIEDHDLDTVFLA